jgi:hypothetical protein
MKVLPFRIPPTAPITFSGMPVWTPLERLVRADAQVFMYMGQVGPIHLNKHPDTGRYLNVHEGTGACYRYTFDGYIPTEGQRAVREVFSEKAEEEEES